MPKLNIVKGTKFFIAFPKKGQENAGGQDYNVISSFVKSISDVAFLITAPLKAGKPIPLDISKKMYFKYIVLDETYLLEGYADGVETVGIRNYWRIRKVSEARTFVVRSAERISASVKVRYSRLNWLSDNGSNVLSTDDFEPGLSLDISASGIALYMNDQVPVGEVLMFSMPAIEGVAKTFIIHGEACWTREVFRGNFRFITGFKFVFDQADDRDKMADYTEAIKEMVVSEERTAKKTTVKRRSSFS